MQINVEASDGLERRMTVQVPEEEIAPEVEARLKNMGRTARVHGFRPGKVPMKVLKRNYGPQVRGEVVSQVLQRTFFEAVSQEQLKPVSAPTIDKVASEPGEGVSYTAVFEIYPDVRTPDVTTLQIVRPVGEVTDQDVDAMIEKLRRQRLTWEDVEREAVEGDQVEMDYRGTVDGEAFEGNENKGVTVVLGSGRLINGFEEGLIGARPGEERELQLTFPEDYHATELAGKAVFFTVKINKVQEPRLPELDEAFIKDFGVEAGTEEAFRNEIRANMEREFADAQRSRTKEKVMDALIAANPVELPKTSVEEEQQRLAEQTTQNLLHQGVANADLNLTSDLFQDQAQRRVALGLLLGEIVKDQGLHPDPEKIRERVETIASTYEQPQQVVSWYYGDRQRLLEIESVVMEDQIVDWILSRAQVSEESTTFDDLMKAGKQA